MAEEKPGGIVPAETRNEKGGVVRDPSRSGIVPVSNVLTLSQTSSQNWGDVLRDAHDTGAQISMTPTSNPIPATNWCPKDKIDLYEQFLLGLGARESSVPGFVGGVVLANKPGGVVPTGKPGGVVPTGKPDGVVPANKPGGVVPVGDV